MHSICMFIYVYRYMYIDVCIFVYIYLCISEEMEEKIELLKERGNYCEYYICV
jgi:hypothetical protein